MSQSRIAAFFTSLSFFVIAALVAGVVVGALAQGTQASWLTGSLGVVESLGQVWLNALRMTVIPLVFSLLVTGIVSIADAAATGRIAVRSLVVFGVLLVGATVYAILAGLGLLAVWPIDPEAGSESRETLRRAKRRMRLDTVVGMVFSNGIAFFVMLMAAVVLHTAGVTDVKNTTQAAEALRPLAGDFAFTLFSLGIIATGLLAVPVLASSAAYAVAEAFGWPEGLERHWREAKGFYAIIGIATIVGTALDFTPIDPMKALYWSAVVNGVVAVPIMVAMMILSGNATVMGSLPVKRKTRFFAWGAVLVMLIAVVLMAWDLLR